MYPKIVAFRKMIDASDLTPAEKVLFKIRLINPLVVAQIDEYFSVMYTRGDYYAIDWENIDWEQALEFWVGLITAIAEILIPLFTKRRRR